MRPLFVILYPAALLLSANAGAAPEFAPNPRQAFEGFAGINPPRPDVPVGSLWIQGYGPTGEAATSDNLETVRSLNGLAIDKNLQLSLSLGLFNLLGIDPKARDHYTARFTDLSIVRVKDLDKVSGPKGEPRIIEALKAGSVTVSTDSELGVGLQSTGWEKHAVQGSGTSGQTGTYSIEARDMFIAIRVATPEFIRGKERELKLREDGRSARMDDFLIVLSRASCAPLPATCSPSFGVVKVNTQTPATVDTVQILPSNEIKLPLPVPISDEQGGLFSSIVLRWIAPCSERKSSGCGRETKLLAHYEGTRLLDVVSVKAKNW